VQEPSAESKAKSVKTSRFVVDILVLIRRKPIYRIEQTNPDKPYKPSLCG
jgi:hypothetical protein